MDRERQEDPMLPSNARDVTTSPEFVQVLPLKSAQVAGFLDVLAERGVHLPEAIMGALDGATATLVTDVLNRVRGGVVFLDSDLDSVTLLTPWLDSELRGNLILRDGIALELANRASQGIRPSCYWCAGEESDDFPNRLLRSLGFKRSPPPLTRSFELRWIPSGWSWWRLDAAGLPNVINLALRLVDQPQAGRQPGRVSVLFDHELLRPDEDNRRRELARFGQSLGD